jgi:hypothetical protein
MDVIRLCTDTNVVAKRPNCPYKERNKDRDMLVKEKGVLRKERCIRSSILE